VDERTYPGLLAIAGIGWLVDGAADGWEPNPLSALSPAESLHADDGLRRMEAGRALFPYPAYPACPAGVAAVSAGGSVLLWVFLVYAAVAVLTLAYTTSPATPTGATPGAWK
jgi:hypothetical protein